MTIDKENELVILRRLFALQLENEKLKAQIEAHAEIANTTRKYVESCTDGAIRDAGGYTLHNLRVEINQLKRIGVS